MKVDEGWTYIISISYMSMPVVPSLFVYVHTYSLCSFVYCTQVRTQGNVIFGSDEAMRALFTNIRNLQGRGREEGAGVGGDRTLPCVGKPSYMKNYFLPNISITEGVRNKKAVIGGGA